MYGDYAKLCRVCMTPGSRDIFGQQSGNSLKLLEKLRYVSMMKIIENDDLPKSLCDMCIVHLNVAYDFKRLAVENDTKLRQYYIENGLNSSNISAILHANINPSNSRSFEENVLTSITSTKDRMPPIFIKTEEDNSNISHESLTYPPDINKSNNSIRVKDFAHLKGDSMVFINNDSINIANMSSEKSILESNISSNNNNTCSNSDGPSTSTTPKNNTIRKTVLKAPGQPKKSARIKKRLVEGRLGKERPREIRNLNIDLNWNYINATRNTRLQRNNSKVMNVCAKKNVNLKSQKYQSKKNNDNESESKSDILDKKVDIEVLNQLNLKNRGRKRNDVVDTESALLIPKTEPVNEISKFNTFR